MGYREWERLSVSLEVHLHYMGRIFRALVCSLGVSPAGFTMEYEVFIRTRTKDRCTAGRSFASSDPFSEADSAVGRF